MQPPTRLRQVRLLCSVDCVKRSCCKSCRQGIDAGRNCIFNAVHAYLADHASEAAGPDKEAALLESWKAYKTGFQQGVALFNKKPKKGIAFMQEQVRQDSCPHLSSTFSRTDMVLYVLRSMRSRITAGGQHSSAHAGCTLPD